MDGNMKLSPDEVMDLCMEHLPLAQTMQDVVNIRIAGRFAWQEKEMGGIEHVQFAYRNNTPIVPPGHCGHPLELVKRGFIDGQGWPKEKTFHDRVKLFKWPDGNHWYVTLDDNDVQVDGECKWNSQTEAMSAAEKFSKIKS